MRKLREYYSKGKVIYRRGKGLKYITPEDGTLYSDGIYPTKIHESDLPEWYIKGYYYSDIGYICTKGIKHLYYRPNLHINHFLRDDFLLISYDKEIVPDETAPLELKGYDIIVCGYDIIRILKAAEKYSGIDIEPFKEQIEHKRQVLMEKHPDDMSMESWKDNTPEVLWSDREWYM